MDPGASIAILEADTGTSKTESALLHYLRLFELREVDAACPPWRGTGQYAQLLQQRYQLAARKYGLGNALPSPDCSRFRVPAAPTAQLKLFE